MLIVSDAVVVGGGLIGCAIARELHNDGMSVCVLDGGPLGREASYAAAGLLAPYAESAENRALLELAEASARLYMEFVASLKEETGIDSQLRDEGTIVIAFTDQEQQSLSQAARALKARGVESESLTGDQVRELEPSISPSVLAGMLVREDRQVENRKLMDAAIKSLENRRVPTHAGTEVLQIRYPREGKWIVSCQSDTFETPTLVLAAGAWSASLAPASVPPVPVSPVRGQIASLEASPARIRHCLISHEGYLVPRLDGRVLVGSTIEKAGFKKSITSGGLHRLLEFALKMVPSLRDASFAEAWAGLRPDTADHLPIIGAGPAPGWITATGHFRNGILLAPITARVIGEIVRGASTAVDIEPFHSRRFSANL